MSPSERKTAQECPRWERDFPVRTGEDAYTTRREFTKFLGLTSIAFFAGTCWSAVKRVIFPKPPLAALAVAKTDEIKVGGYKLFRLPEENSEPCILIRLERERYVAYSQHCTHLACPVHFDAGSRELRCPCHAGFFSAEDGRVLAGPPKRALPAYKVELREGTVFVSRGEHA